MLVTGRSRCIGSSSFHAPICLRSMPSYPVMIYGLNEVCRERGYRLVIEAAKEPPGDGCLFGLWRKANALTV